LTYLDGRLRTDASLVVARMAGNPDTIVVTSSRKRLLPTAVPTTLPSGGRSARRQLGSGYDVLDAPSRRARLLAVCASLLFVRPSTASTDERRRIEPRS